jgi:cytochrome P450
MDARIEQSVLEQFPVFEGDLFDPEVLADSYPTFRRIRDLGDAVWSPALGMFLVGRYRDVQSGLRAHESLISGHGVTANAVQNEMVSGPNPTGVLTMDGGDHAHFKRVLSRPMTPKALQMVQEELDTEAAKVVALRANGQEFEGLSGLAWHLPIHVVARMVGLTEAGHEELMRWAAAAFDAFGPVDNPRTLAALPTVMDYIGFTASVTRETVLPGGWAASLFDAVDRGEVPADIAQNMIFDYATPALDTTILATGELLWNLGTVDGAFESLRNDPSLIPSAVYEAVRMATPIRGFTRVVKTDFRLSESVLPAGSRAFLINASANRDERHYPDPDRFDVRRNPRDNLGWGHGRHLCAGLHLSRMEMEALLRALVRSVRAIEAGTPKRMLCNGLHGYQSFPLVLHSA